jgi:hypothetical protein
MKTLGIVLIVAGVVSFAMPVVGYLAKGKPSPAGSGEVVTNKTDPLSFGPMLGVMFVSVGGGILVAGAITNKK